MHRIGTALLVWTLFCGHPLLGQGTPDVWVLNATSQSISIIDSVGETVTGSISLGGTPNPAGLAFSTAANMAGDYAFVTRGNSLIVIDTTTQLVSTTIDVTTMTGFPAVQSLSMAGLEPARTQRFDLDPGPVENLVTKAYLHIAANVVPTGGGPSQPWFIVLDQAPLLGGSPLLALVQAGPLFIGAPPAIPGEALDVTVVSWKFGLEYQRAWYTVRVPDVLERIQAVRVSSPREINVPNWSVRQVHETTLAAGKSAPDSLKLGSAPPYAELVLLPRGPQGDVISPESQFESCSMPGAEPRQVLITGPGRNSHIFFILDNAGDAVRMLNQGLLDTSVAPCTTSAFATGDDPVSMTALGEYKWRKLFVANRGSNSVTVVRNDGQVATVGAPNFSSPVVIRTRRTSATSCSIENAEAAGGVATWVPVGCDPGTEFLLWLQPEGARTGHEEWIEVGVTATDTSTPLAPGNRGNLRVTPSD